ncbi:tRNA 2-thiouridine(34) synthase MnmA [Candidatus Falkowbacteria bacterium]|nr:MAG: tRNA 2-thiouridine(34) synthase MnmA [Candidatus Falkowbacteria bacterium]
MRSKKQKVVVAMSGGVDSSAAAWILKKQGHEIIGIYMRLIASQEKSEEAARKVCRHLGIKFYPLNLRDKFKKEIINYFISDYRLGKTPNPCVKCNKVIKFKELLRVREELGADFLATGHYVKSRKYKVESKKYLLKLFRGEDKGKDQSYFLYNLTQAQLKHILFPLGKYRKAEIKKIADDNKLPYLEKESQDVCFLIRDNKLIPHNDFLKEHINLTPGSIKTLRGKKIGEHQGLPLYTVGQRRGVEIGGTGPYYVVKGDYKTNTLYVSENSEDPALFKKEFEVKNMNWTTDQEPKYPFECETVIRYRHKAVKCIVESYKVESNKVESRKYKICLLKPERAVTAGQSAVFYNQNEVLGGGIIDKN